MFYFSDNSLIVCYSSCFCLVHRRRSNIFWWGGGGGSSGESKTAEGIRDAKKHRFVLYIAFAGKSGGLQPPSPLGSAAHVVFL